MESLPTSPCGRVAHLGGGMEEKSRNSPSTSAVSVESPSKEKSTNRHSSASAVSVESPSKAPIDISTVQDSLRKLRRSLTSPALEELKASGAQPSGSSSQEVSRLAQRLECMERAFLMSPMEAIRSRPQDVEASESTWAHEDQCTELCAQFVEVLERGREARERELLALEHRVMARFTEALECERAARQKEVAELREAMARERVMFERSSTGGTTHRSLGDSLNMGIPTPEISSEVDVDIEPAVTTSKTALSQHVTELHRKLSDDLIEKLRETMSTSTEAWESRLQAVTGLLSHCPTIDADPTGPNEQRLKTSGERLQVKAGQEAAQWDHQLHVQSELSRINIPMERNPGTPRHSRDQSLSLRSDSQGHASADDIADEGPASLRPLRAAQGIHIRRVLASNSALAKQHGPSGQLIALGEKVRGAVSQGFGPGCQAESSV